MRNDLTDAFDNVVRLFIMDCLSNGKTLTKFKSSTPKKFAGYNDFKSSMNKLSQVLDSAAANCVSFAWRDQVKQALEKHPDMVIYRLHQPAKSCKLCARARKCIESIELRSKYDQFTMKLQKSSTVTEEMPIGSYCLQVNTFT